MFGIETTTCRLWNAWFCWKCHQNKNEMESKRKKTTNLSHVWREVCSSDWCKMNNWCEKQALIRQKTRDPKKHCPIIITPKRMSFICIVCFFMFLWCWTGVNFGWIVCLKKMKSQTAFSNLAFGNNQTRHSNQACVVNWTSPLRRRSKSNGDRLNMPGRPGV